MKSPWKLALLAVAVSVAIASGISQIKGPVEAAPTSIIANFGTCSSPGAATTTLIPGGSYCITTSLGGVSTGQALNFEATGAVGGGLAHFSCSAPSVGDTCGTATQTGGYELDYTAVLNAGASPTTHRADLTMTNCTGNITYAATQAGSPLSVVFNCTPSPEFNKTNDTGGIASAGEVFTWRLEARNFQSASFASIDDTLPPGFVPGTINIEPDSAGTCTVTPPANPSVGHNILCNLVTPLPALVTVDIPVTAPSGTCGEFTNSGSIFIGGILGSSDTVTVVDPEICPVDVTFEKTSSVDALLLGESFDWIIELATDGETGTNDYVVTDTVPDGFTIGTLPAECSAAGQVVTCTYDDVVGDIDETITIPVAAPEECGAFTNEADLSINGTPAASANDWVGIVDAGPEDSCPPSFTKSNDTGGVVDSGGSFNWTLTAENVVTLAFGSFHDELPAGFVPGTPVVSPASAGTCTTAEDAGAWTVDCEFGGPIATNHITVTIPVSAPSDACGEFENQATGVFQGPISTNIDTIFVVDLELCPVDVTFEKSSSVDAVLFGGPFNWIIEVATDGETGTNDYVVMDTVPDGFTIGTLPAECSAAGQVVTCTYNDVEGDIDETITIPVTGPEECGAFTNEADLSINGVPAASADDWVGVVDAGPAGTCLPSFTKTNDTGGVVETGDSFNWTMRAENIVAFAFGTFTDELPAGFVPGTPVVSPASAGTCTTAEDAGVWTVDCVFPGPIASNEVSVTIPVTAPSDACGEFENQATGVFQGPISTNIDTIFVVDLELCPVDVTFEKSSSVDAVLFGGPFNWIIELATDGETGTNDYVVTDTVPEGFAIGMLPAECSAAGQVVTCTYDDVVGDIDETITIPVTAPDECGAFTNEASLSINGVPAASADDWVGVVDVGPLGTCLPAFTKSNDTGGAVDAGDSFNWTLTAENIVAFAFGTFTDELPAGFVPGTPVVSPAGSGTCTTAEAAGIWTVDCVFPGPIASNEVSVTIPVTAPSGSSVCGEYENQAIAIFQGPASTNVDVVTVENCPEPGDPALDKSHEGEDAFVAAGESFAWTLTLTDVNGLAVDVSDTLPDGFQLLSASSNDAGVVCATDLDADSVDCTGTATQGTVVITINVMAPTESCGLFQNMAGGTAGDTPVSDTDGVTVEGCDSQPPVGEFLKYTSSDDEFVLPGEVFTWFIDVPDTDGYWEVMDTLPAGFQIVGVVTPDAYCQENSASSFSCSGESGASSLTIAVTVKAPFVCGSYTNTAHFRDAPDATWMEASDTVRVVGCDQGNEEEEDERRNPRNPRT